MLWLKIIAYAGVLSYLALVSRDPQGWLP